MAVIRINKTADYTVMSNTHFKEKEMSLKAKGLLSLMLSLPDDWDYSIAGLVTLSKDGKDSVMGALNELENFGYLVRTKLIDKNGRFAGYDYDIFEKPNMEKSNADEPYSGKPNTEKPTQLNTNQSIKKELKTNELNTNIKSVFDYWNSKNIITHRKLTPIMEKQIPKAIKEYGIESIKEYIDRYAKVYHDKDYYFNTQWSLDEFLKQSNGISTFTDEGSKWLNYLNRSTSTAQQNQDQAKNKWSSIIGNAGRV